MIRSIFRIVKYNLFMFLSSYKLLVLIAVSCIMPLNTIYQLKIVDNWQGLSVLDGLLYEFGLYTLHYLIFIPCCIFLIYDFVKPNLMDNFVFFRINNRHKIFFVKIFSCIFMSLLMLSVFVISSCVILSVNFDITTNWGKSLIQAQKISPILLNESIVDYPATLMMMYQLLLIFMSFTVFSFLLLFFMEVTKRKAFALVLAMLSNFIILILAKGNFANNMFLPCANTFLLNIDVKTKGSFAFVFPLLYWMFLGIMLCFINYIVISRKDFLYEDTPEDEC